MSDATRLPDHFVLLEHRGWVRSLARQLLRDENDVDDVEQETWAVALRTGPSEPRALRSWLGVVSSRLALQRIRGDERRARREDALATAPRAERSAADLVAEADAHGNVVQAVRALEEPYRTTVLMRYFDGLEIAEVARRMDVPLETVRTRLKRGHERLRTSLEREHRDSLAILLAPIGGAVGHPGLSWAGGAGGAVASSGHVASVVRAAILASGGAAVIAAGAWIVLPDGDDPATAAVAAGRAAAAPKGDGGAGGGAGRAVHPGGRAPRPAADPVPAPPPGDREEPTVPASDPWIAYDLADGKPLAGFAVRVRTAEGETTVSTDAAGRVPVERAGVLDLKAEDAGAWTLARPEEVAVKEEPSLWFWRERGVSGTVRTANLSQPLAPGSVTFRWETSRSSSVKPDEPGSGFRWLLDRGFDARNDRPIHVRVDATGAVSGTVPALLGATLAAEAPGYGPAATPLVWPRLGDCAIALELRPLIRIVGRLLDEAGNPVIGERVSLATSMEVASDDEYLKLQPLRRRAGMIYSGRPGAGVLVFLESASTDVRGIFRFDAATIGQGVVSVWKQGCLACRRELGPLRADVAPFELRLARSDVRVVLTRSGKPIASGGVMLQAADGRDNGFPLATDAEGRADAGWLEDGRWYRVVAGDRNACFLWKGQSSIDVDQLPKEPTKDR